MRCVECGKDKGAHLAGGRCYEGDTQRVYATMELPAGKTCADCRYCACCVRLYGVKPENVECDFFPVRFDQAAAVSI